MNIYEDTATSMRALVEGIDKTGFSRDEPWKMTGSSLPEHETFFFYLQRICNHCTYPGCLAACPRKAIYKRPEDGIVLIDQNRCRGYKKCVEQCPYKKPMYRGTTRVSEKCIACYPRIEGKDPLTGGEPMETRCMAACVGKIRMQSLMRIGDDGLWAEDRWHPLYYTIRVEQVALPLYPQWGTEPNGFYIPPRHSPRGYARQMFGPGVDNAIEKYLVPSRELLAVLQLWRASQQIIFRYDVIPGPKVFETQIHGQAVRDVQRYRAGVQQVGEGSGAHSGGGADLHSARRARDLALTPPAGASHRRAGRSPERPALCVTDEEGPRWLHLADSGVYKNESECIDKSSYFSSSWW